MLRQRRAQKQPRRCCCRCHRCCHHCHCRRRCRRRCRCHCPWQRHHPYQTKLPQRRRRWTTLLRHQDCWLNCLINWKRATSKSHQRQKKHITKIKLKHYEIDWLNPEVISSECIKYLKKNESLPSTHESQLFFLMNKFEPGDIKLSFSNAIGKMGHTASKIFYVKKRLYRNLFNWYCLSWSIQSEKLSCKFWYPPH